MLIIISCSYIIIINIEIKYDHWYFKVHAVVEGSETAFYVRQNSYKLFFLHFSIK